MQQNDSASALGLCIFYGAEPPKNQFKDSSACPRTHLSGGLDGDVNEERKELLE